MGDKALVVFGKAGRTCWASALPYGQEIEWIQEFFAAFQNESPRDVDLTVEIIKEARGVEWLSRERPIIALLLDRDGEHWKMLASDIYRHQQDANHASFLSLEEIAYEYTGWSRSPIRPLTPEDFLDLLFELSQHGLTLDREAFFRYAVDYHVEPIGHIKRVSFFGGFRATGTLSLLARLAAFFFYSR